MTKLKDPSNLTFEEKVAELQKSPLRYDLKWEDFFEPLSIKEIREIKKSFKSKDEGNG